MFSTSKVINWKILNRRLIALLSSYVLTTLFFVLSSVAQQPFQDEKGESSVFLDKGGFAQINVADPSIRLGYLYDVSDKPWIFGFNLSGKLNGNKAGILNNGKSAPDAKFNFSIGYEFHTNDVKNERQILVTPHIVGELEKIYVKNNTLGKNEKMPAPTEGETYGKYIERVQEILKKPLTASDAYKLPEFSKFSRGFARLTFQGGDAFQQFNLFDSAASFDKQVYKKNFHSPSAELIFSKQVKPRVLFGASLGINRSNNSEDLTEVEVRDINPITNNGTTREVSRIRKALRGDFKQSTRIFTNQDLVWFPKSLGSRLAFDFFSRIGITGNSRGVRPGIGLFYTKEGAPTHVIGGVNISYFKGKANVGLVAGFNF